MGGGHHTPHRTTQGLYGGASEPQGLWEEGFIVTKDWGATCSCRRTGLHFTGWQSSETHEVED